MKTISNAVRLIGNIGMDPELKTLSNGKVVAKFSLATTDYYTDKDGEKAQSTIWHNIAAWGKLATIAEQICKKGRRVAIDGKLSNRTYEDSKGEKRYFTEVIANEIMVMGDNPKAKDENPKVKDKSSKVVDESPES